MTRAMPPGSILGSLLLIWNFSSFEIDIDSCLDAGGAWVYASQNCQHK
ncbi:hypothetical protein NOLU111490_00795 [Novosphingobium lubricantis]